MKTWATCLAWGPAFVLGACGRLAFYSVPVDAAGDAIAQTDTLSTQPDGSPPGTVDIRVNEGSDDVYESLSGYVDLEEVRLLLNTNNTVGLRFVSVPIPPGTTIAAAHIAVTAYANASGCTLGFVDAEAADDAEPFLSVSGNVSARTFTSPSTTQVIWEPWRTGDIHRTADLAAVVQEVVDRPGWQAGASMVVRLRNAGDPGSCQITSFQGDPLAAALLHVEFP
jgi:hypothetical protein